MTLTRHFLCCLALMALSCLAFADGIGWRTDGTGIYRGAAPPTDWAPDRGIVWATPMPSWSNASPVLVGDRLFVTAEPDTLICVDAASGQVLWQKTNGYADLSNGSAPAALPKTHDVNGYSSPTPVSDGIRVFALFGHGVVSCYDLYGTRLWSRFIEQPTNGWGHSTSPVLADGRLIVHILNLTALDPTTGETLWQVRLPEDWGTPQVGSISGTTIIATANGDLVQAADGKVLAQTLRRLDFGNPILADGVVYYVQNGGKAFKLPDAVAEPFQPQLLWETQVRKDRYYAGCILDNGIIYAVTQAGIFSAVDTATGQIIYEQALGLGGTMYPSITLAGGLLYASSDQGNTAIIKPGRQYEEVARLSLEPFRSCPVFDGSRVYIRAMSKLYCIGQ